MELQDPQIDVALELHGRRPVDSLKVLNHLGFFVGIDRQVALELDRSHIRSLLNCTERSAGRVLRRRGSGSMRLRGG